MTSLDDAAATLRVVVPGFVALRVFYLRALPTRRSDLELVLWSLVVSLPIYGLATVILRRGDDLATLLLALALGALAGEIAVRIWWWAARRWPRFRIRMVPTAWDAVIGRPEGSWLQVRTSDGVNYHGWVEVVADASEADNPDLYLRDPSYINDGKKEPITGIEGVLIPRSSILSILRFEDPDPSDLAATPDA